MRAADPNSAALAVRASLVGVVNGPVRALACPGLEYKLGLEQMLFRIRNAEVLEHVPISSWVLSLVHVVFDKSAGWTIPRPSKRRKFRTLIVNNCLTA